MSLFGAGTANMAPPPLPEGPEVLAPSSIAAIFQNLSKVNGTPQLADRDEFQQLLAELLGSNDNDPSEVGAFEIDLSVNYRLIYIVTSAGLTILLQDDPFAVQEELVVQAVNSLLVIRMTIQRCPQVLFRPPPDQSQMDEPQQDPLFLWLLPRLLPLLGHPRGGKLSQDLLETLECIFVATTKVPDTWKYTTVLWSYLECSFRCTSLLNP